MCRRRWGGVASGARRTGDRGALILSPRVHLGRQPNAVPQWECLEHRARAEGPHGCGARDTHLGEKSPPLPVPQLEVGRAVPLNHLHGRQLLLPLGEGPGAGEGVP